MAGRRPGAAVLLGAATLTVLATSACSMSGTVTANGSDATNTWRTVSEPATSGSVTNQKLMFPDTNFTASIDGYDDAAHMIEFHVVKWAPSDMDQGTYRIDPNKPDQYRLPLAGNARILSVSTLCYTHQMPDLNGVPCSTVQLITGLKNGDKGDADIHVDATDHIDTMKEDYLP